MSCKGLADGSSPEPGPVTGLVHQAADKGSEIVQWLEDREPADVLADVRRFAQRRPVMFLALCGLAGVVAGRITRGAVAANTSIDSPKPANALGDQPSYLTSPGYTAAPDYSTGPAYTTTPGYEGGPATGAYGTTPGADYTGTTAGADYTGTTAGADYTGTTPGADYTGTTPGPDYTGGATR